MKIAAIVVCFLLVPVIFGCARKTAESSPAMNGKAVREIFDGAKTPALRAVGKINFSGARWCSVTLVAEDIGVTAGHCFLTESFKYDLAKDLEPFSTSVIFRKKDNKRIENVSVKRVLAAQSNPDYAIVQFDQKIPADEIMPLKPARLTLDEMRADETRLGCAGYNGDKILGNDGLLMTISRSIEIIAEESSAERVDTTCFSNYGGSGGLFFRQTGADEYEFIGVVWGMTDEKYDEKGELVKADKIITSITPVGVFYDELKRFTAENQ